MGPRFRLIEGRKDGLEIQIWLLCPGYIFATVTSKKLGSVCSSTKK
jgi:hypothetical protein